MHEGIIIYINSVIFFGIVYILVSDVFSYSQKVITKTSVAKLQVSLKSKENNGFFYMKTNRHF